MIDELRKLRELTETLTGNGYLRDQADEWSYALDAIPDCVFIVNNLFEIKFANKALTKRLGRSKEDLYNKFCFKEIREYVNGDPSPSWRGHEIVQLNPTLSEIYIENLNGWFDITRSPIYTSSGDNLGFICVLQDVTVKRRAIEGLVYRESTLNTIFNTAPIGIGMVEKDSRILKSVNKYIIDKFGYSEEELINNSIKMLYANESEFNRVGRIKYRDLVEKGMVSLETVFKTKSGELVDIHLKSSKMLSGNTLVFTITDITERKLKERILKLNEDRLESVLRLTVMGERAEDVIIEYALEEAVRLTNSKIGYLYFVNQPDDGDLSKVDLSLFKWSASVTKECNAKTIKHYPLKDAGCWADCVRTKQPVIQNDYLALSATYDNDKLPDGHVKLYRHMSVPVVDDGGIVAIAGVGNKFDLYDETDVVQLSLFMNSMWDILKRKRAENEALKSEEKFKAVFMKHSDSVTIIRTDTEEFIDVNPAFEKISGYSREEVIGSNTIDIDLWAFPDERKAFYETVVNTAGKVDNFKATFKMKDGILKRGAITSSVVLLDDIPHVISTIREMNNENFNTRG